MIILFPRSSESIGNAVRRFAELGYSLNNRHGRIVAEPLITNVLALKPARRSIVTAVFDFAKRDQS